MDIAKLDDRLANKALTVTDIKWYSPLEAPFSIHGLMYDEEISMYVRMPQDIAKQVTPSVMHLSRCTAGGRVRFRTNSTYVALTCVVPAYTPAAHMATTTLNGFSIYVNGMYRGHITPAYADLLAQEDRLVTFRSFVNVPKAENPGELCDVEIYFPLYGCVKQLFVGLREGSSVEAPTPYAITEPLVFYGSSITQGACASRPGMDYTARLSRMLNADYVNLGFSGNGNAEPAMLDYLTTLPASVYVYDYNYYSNRPERVLPPHLSIYEKLREANPLAGIMMVDKPSTIYSPQNYQARNEIIRASYDETIRRGDDLVGYLDGADFFGHEIEHDSCLVDGDHPNAIGFWQMAKSLYEPLRTLLERRAIKQGEK